MFEQVALLRERLAALGARERFVARVNARVCGQRRAVAERLVTHVACVHLRGERAGGGRQRLDTEKHGGSNESKKRFELQCDTLGIQTCAFAFV